MKSPAVIRFLLLYGAICLIAVFTALTLGSFFIEKNEISEASEALYREASSLSSGDASLTFSKAIDMKEIYSALRTMASAEQTTILIFNTEGSLIIDTDKTQTADAGRIDDFDYASFSGRYTIGTFYGHFDTDHLTAISPIIRNMKVVGYLTVSKPLSLITRGAEGMMQTMLLLVIIALALAGLLIVLLIFSIIAPIRKIKAGADEIAGGHLDCRINILLKDELGQVADSLNHMAAQLQKSGEYQRTFISNVSHDFRSPLTSIKGFTEAMLDGTIPSELHPRYLKIIQAEAERLEKLTRSTLTLENLDRRLNHEQVLEIEDFDINHVIRDTAAVFEGSCRQKKISFSLSLYENGLAVRADREKIKQVLYNLIDNAVKFSENDAVIYLETNIKKGKCEVSVKDEGCGIPSENLGKIWDRFYKSDPSRGKDKKGTGLGLSIVHEIILAHDEAVTVSSTPDVGTTFCFTLPLVKNSENESLS